MADSVVSRYQPQLLSVLRIVTALLFMQHGVRKMFGLLGGTQVPLMSLSGIAGILEVFGGLLVLVGLFTRPVSFVLSGMMAVAYFMEHQPRAFFPIENAGEPAILYTFVFLYFVAAGPGPWSIDAWRGGVDGSRV